MNYKETLIFVGQCLTITHNKQNQILVKENIASGNVDWDNVVKLSTKHYVFPALYCNLKRANFLHYLPEELVNYMKHITDINRERNLQIIEQAKEINELLLANNIIPIFLKGTAFLLQNLYYDIAERMVGDIDFLVAKEDATMVLEILKNDNYKFTIEEATYLDNSKHYPRMVKKGCINAIEVHREMTLKKHRPYFNYDDVKPNLITSNSFMFLSFKDQVLHTLINQQLNDYGYLYKSIALRNCYDLYLLSYKTNTLKAIKQIPTLFKFLNVFLSNASFVFNTPTSILFEKNKQTTSYHKSIIKLLDSPAKYKSHHLRVQFLIFSKARMKILIKTFYSKKHFIFVSQRLKNINWYKRKLGFKSTL